MPQAWSCLCLLTTGACRAEPRPCSCLASLHAAAAAAAPVWHPGGAHSTGCLLTGCCCTRVRVSLQVATEAEAVEAFREAQRLSDHFVFIEVIVHKADAAPASRALRQGFMAHHFAAIPGYKHLNLGASLAGGGSSLTAGGCHEERCASVGPALPGPGGECGVNCSSAGAGGTGGGGGVLGPAHGAAAVAAAEAAGGGPVGSGGSGGVTSGVGGGVLDALGEARQAVMMGRMHHAAGSSTCLVAVADGQDAAEAAGSAGGAAPGVGGGVKRQGSRLGLPHAKRLEAEESE